MSAAVSIYYVCSARKLDGTQIEHISDSVLQKPNRPPIHI